MERPAPWESSVGGGSGLSALPTPSSCPVRKTLLETLPKQQSRGTAPTVEFHFAQTRVLRWEGEGRSHGMGEGQLQFKTTSKWEFDSVCSHDPFLKPVQSYS